MKSVAQRQRSGGLRDNLPVGCLVRIRSLYDGMRPSERRVADFILANPEQAVLLSTAALAAQARTSESTVVKFAQRLGYRGYRELKIALAVDSGAADPHAAPIYGDIEFGDSLDEVRRKLLAAHQRALQETMEMLDTDTWRRAAEAIAQARRLHFYGVGASGFVALDAQHKFARIGIEAWAYTDPHLQSAFAALLGPGDVAVGISHSGGTLDTIHALRTASRGGATTICITRRMDSPLARVADIRIFSGGSENALRIGAIGSRVAQMAVIDALFIAVAMRRGKAVLEYLRRSREAVADKHVEAEDVGVERG